MKLKGFKIPKPPVHSPCWFKDKVKRHKVLAVLISAAVVGSAVIPEIAHACHFAESGLFTLLLFEDELAAL